MQRRGERHLHRCWAGTAIIRATTVRTPLATIANGFVWQALCAEFSKNVIRDLFRNACEDCFEVVLREQDVCHILTDGHFLAITLAAGVKFLQDVTCSQMKPNSAKEQVETARPTALQAYCFRALMI
jgi:hypothetical protein